MKTIAFTTKTTMFRCSSHLCRIDAVYTLISVLYHNYCIHKKKNIDSKRNVLPMPTKSETFCLVHNDYTA